MSTTYTISDLAQEYDITTRTIRFYEDQQLLSPQRDGSRRIFHERDRVRLKLILRGKRLGFTLAETRELFKLYDTQPGKKGQLRYLLEKIEEHRSTLHQQQEDIRIVLQEMEELEAHAKTALEEMEP
jgi:DNA-binding transcriptional MerR regulator